MKILIIYDSRLGAVEKMARLIARGVASQGDCEAVVRRVPDLGDTNLSDWMCAVFLLPSSTVFLFQHVGTAEGGVGGRRNF